MLTAGRRQSLRCHALLSPPITDSYVAATWCSGYCILTADISPPPSMPVVGPHAGSGLYKPRGRLPAQAGPGREAFGQGPSAEQDWPGCATRSHAQGKPLALPWPVLAIQRGSCRAGHSSVPADGAPCQLAYLVLAPVPPACIPRPSWAVPAEA